MEVWFKDPVFGNTPTDSEGEKTTWKKIANSLYSIHGNELYRPTVSEPIGITLKKIANAFLLI